jgi:hypothetical protein
MITDQWLRHAAEAIANGHAGPAHRHLMRASDCGLDDDQVDRFAELSDRLDPIEKAAGTRWGQPYIEEAGQ